MDLHNELNTKVAGAGFSRSRPNGVRHLPRAAFRSPRPAKAGAYGGAPFYSSNSVHGIFVDQINLLCWGVTGFHRNRLELLIARMVLCLHTYRRMSDRKEIKVLEHIETLRLFDSSRGDLQGKFRFEDWESEHLAVCQECQHIREVFSRQFTAIKPKSEAA